MCPLLTAASYEKLASFFNIIGGSYRNPLDAGGTIGMGFVPGNLQRLFDILEEDGNMDARGDGGGRPRSSRGGCGRTRR